MDRHDTLLGTRWAPSRLRRVLRSRLVQATTLTVVAFATGSTLFTAHADLRAERARWGATVEVLVMVDAVDAGELISGAFTTAEVPEAMVPTGAASIVSGDTRAKTRLYPGELLLADRITERADQGLALGTVGLTAQVTAGLPLVEVGDLVDLWTADSATFSSHKVAGPVLVLAISERDVTVAVPDTQVADVVVAALKPLTVTLVG